MAAALIGRRKSVDHDYKHCGQLDEWKGKSVLILCCLPKAAQPYFNTGAQVVSFYPFNSFMSHC